MQPDTPLAAGNINAPDYSFLTNPSKRRVLMPRFLSSGKGKIISAIIALIICYIILLILRAILFPPAISKADYLLVADRQQEILHILSIDVTSNTLAELSPNDQDFASTAYLSLGTAQQKTVQVLTDYRYKVDPGVLTATYDSSIDQQFTSALQTNTFDSFFKSEMQQQLSLYEQNLNTAYKSTKVNSNGRLLLKEEYAEAQLLLKGLNSTTS